ncbi:MAG: AAA family ATPase, partial [Elusimicrobiota bacterium]|nr:AAA family ATPase [Elusimicrobiota bacterium]
METQDKSILGNGRLQKLPVGIQEFKDLREEQYLYVDKTKQIYDLINRGSLWFLSRPRRFGKSLLASTLESLFRGERYLFKGLYIEDKWNWTKTYNVIRIDFTKVTKLTPARLEQSLASRLDEIAKHNGIVLEDEYPTDKFSKLIGKLYEKNGKKVVILIDEYDKPILDRLKAMKETEISIANKEILGDFYGVLKGESQYLRFIFITGITRFSGVSIFSGLNNLKDLTLRDKFADLCGYTQKELEDNFKPYIEALSSKNKRSYEQELTEIKLWYNGYTWDGETAIYNPFSTLNLFDSGEFKTYWFDSGSPAFLIDYIKNSSVGTDQVFENESFSEIELMNFSPEKTTTTALLFQTGYLTIKKKIEITLELDEGMIETADEYLLAMPNREVRRAFAQHILLSYVDESEMKRIINTRTEFVKAIK